MQWEMASLCGFSVCFQLLLLVPLCFFYIAPVDAAPVIVNRSEEVRALLNFRDQNGLTRYKGYWDNWKANDATPCVWFGVTCTANFTVEGLDISGWGLFIFTIEALYSLTDLRRLDMSSNSVQLDDIDSISHFTELTELDLSETFFFELPASISACKNLRLLVLDQNYLAALPAGMSDLVNLQFLSVANNSITGPFPTQALGSLSSLVSLDLSLNSFNGSIPSLPNLTNLLVLNLSNNYFSGFEEPLFIAPQSLEELDVSYNQLEGTIPSTILNLENLTLLNMSGNSLSGHIPAGFSRLLNYSYATLDLSQNQLTGEIPSDMLNPTLAFSSANLSFNHLTGNIPINGSQLFSFSTLDFSYNNLSGLVPSNFFAHRYSSVQFLRLNDNQLSGDIVDIFLGPAFARTQEVHIENNLFTGDLARMANISSGVSSLIVADFRNNLLQWSTSEAIPDPITATLEVLTSASTILEEFRVGGNNFSGTSFPTACFLNSTRDRFFYVLDLSNSQLKGEILGAAFNSTCLPSIQLLNLSRNHATGQLSESIIVHQPHAIVDVSNNDLSGPLPVIPSSSDQYNPRYFTGNDKLCGYPLTPCAQGTGVQWWVLLIIIGGSLIIAVGSCLAATWRLRVYHKQHQQDADLIRALLERDSATLMPLRDLKKATSNFAETAQIGEGGFGIVYTGRLHDGTIVAIKRSKREGSEEDKAQFLNEVRVLSQVNHRNLVKLLGCCLENKIAALVFEFISNGTLQEHLQAKIGTVRLTWKQRLNIAVQTADALNYLHSMASFPIYHRDVKSANILLDENLNAKVADFGISKLAPLQATHVSTVAIQGTIGYMDPEYYTSYQLTDKSDVYSFGVVLLELISAKPALDFSRGGEETGLVYFASPYIERGELGELIDPALRDTYSDQVGSGMKSILTVGQLAMKCLDMRSKARPSMNEVLKELQNLLAQLDSISGQSECFIMENPNEDMECSREVLLSNFLSEDSSNVVMQSDPNGIQMSSLSGRRTGRSRSVK